MIKVLIFSDSLTIYIVSGCQLLTFFEEKKQKLQYQIASGCQFFDYNSASSSFGRKPFPIRTKIIFLLEQEEKNAAFTEKLSPDRNGAERS